MAGLYNIIRHFVMALANTKAVAITGRINLQLNDKIFEAANFMFIKLPIMIVGVIRSCQYYFALIRIFQGNQFECVNTNMFGSMTLIGACTKQKHNYRGKI